MLGLALTFLVIAIIAAVFGFGGIAAGAATIAKILFFVFVTTTVGFGAHRIIEHDMMLLLLLLG